MMVTAKIPHLLYHKPPPYTVVKDHRQRIPKKCSKAIFRKINTEEIFSNLHSLQIKTIFQEKLNLRKFTVAVYVIFIYGRDVTHWCQL